VKRGYAERKLTVKDLIGNFAVVRVAFARLKQFNQNVDRIGVLKCLMCGAQHGQILNEFEHSDLVPG
jgi:hypothetical protein